MYRSVQARNVQTIVKQGGGGQATGYSAPYQRVQHRFRSNEPARFGLNRASRAVSQAGSPAEARTPRLLLLLSPSLSSASSFTLFAPSQRSVSSASGPFPQRSAAVPNVRCQKGRRTLFFVAHLAFRERESKKGTGRPVNKQTDGANVGRNFLCKDTEARNKREFNSYERPKK